MANLLKGLDTKTAGVLYRLGIKKLNKPKCACLLSWKWQGPYLSVYGCLGKTPCRMVEALHRR